MNRYADYFNAMPLCSGIFLDAEFTAPWCVAARVGPEDCAPFVEVPHAIVAFHYVYEGVLELRVGGEPPVRVGAGEVIILPRNDAHTVASDGGIEPVSADDLVRPGADGGLARIVHGGGGARTKLICGFLGSERQYDPVLAMLPAAIRVTIPDAATAAWFEGSFRLAAKEMTFDDSNATQKLARLTELLFVDAVHRFISGQSDEQFSWFEAMADPKILRALSKLHANLKRHWTTEELAGEAGMSRSAFAARFSELTGQTPIRYLAALRLQAAAQRLRRTGESLARIAFEVGYESEAAFSRAFKREYGLPPATWRDAGRDELS